MIVLDNAGTRALSLINTQNGANVEVCFSDYTTSTGAYARGVPTLTTIISSTTTSICATPASGVIRDIDYVNIYNTYAGSQTFTVQITSGSGGPFILVVATLAQNESLNYTHGSGWCAMDANGNRKEATGTVLASLTVTGNATIGGTLGVTGATTLAALTVSGAVIGAASQAVFNSVSTTVNAFGAATTLNIGNAGGTNTVLGATTFSQALTASAGLTLSGSASNIALGSNYISVGGTDAGLNFDGSNNALFSAAVDVTGQLQGIKSTATQIRAYGWDAVSGTGTDRGSITLGSNAAYYGQLNYANTGSLYLDNAYDNAVATTYIRVRTLGTPVNAAVFNSSGMNGVLGATTPAALSATTGAFTKVTAGDAIIFTNGGASNKTGYLYTDNQYVGLFDLSSAQSGANGIYFDVTNSTVKTQIASSGAITTVSSTGLAVTGTCSPSAHNTYDLGSTGTRWKDVWCQTGAFNGSDARLKTPMQDLTANELQAAKQLAKEVGTYQWLESVAKKGSDARKHIGMTVQRAIEIMESNGLKPFDYGFIGYDEWDEKTAEHPAIEAVEATDDSPAVEAKAAWTEITQKAGNTFSFRHDQLLLFIARGFEARLAALEAA